MDRGDGNRRVCKGTHPLVHFRRQLVAFVASPHGTVKTLVDPRNLGGILGGHLVPWGSANSGETNPGFFPQQ